MFAVSLAYECYEDIIKEKHYKICIKGIKIRIPKFTYGRDTFIEKSNKEVIS